MPEIRILGVAENWVAVIVSCMPAVATFCRVYVQGSRIFVSLQSRLFSWTSSSSTTSKNQTALANVSHSGSRGTTKPRSSVTTAQYLRLEERINGLEARALEGTIVLKLQERSVTGDMLPNLLLYSLTKPDDMHDSFWHFSLRGAPVAYTYMLSRFPKVGQRHIAGRGICRRAKQAHVEENFEVQISSA
ncbi:MAG: hypothetical protein Q9225_004430 [Loekoesia sp. 1 TL-2023]